MLTVDDFDFALPPELIAQHPAGERRGSRLLHVDGPQLADRRFSDLPSLLAPGDLLVFNDTRVIRARMFGQKESGGQVEVLIERIVDARHALAQVRASKSPKPGSRPLENNMYVLSPNMGTYYLFPDSTTPIDTFGGRSYIINHRGAIVGKQEYGAGSTYVAGVIDIEQLRHHRASAQVSNWMKDVRAELAQIIYDREIYPKNLYLDREPMKHAEYKEKVIDRQIALMHERGIWKKPSR